MSRLKTITDEEFCELLPTATIEIGVEEGDPGSEEEAPDGRIMEIGYVYHEVTIAGHVLSLERSFWHPFRKPELAEWHPDSSELGDWSTLQTTLRVVNDEGKEVSEDYLGSILISAFNELEDLDIEVARKRKRCAPGCRLAAENYTAKEWSPLVGN